MLARSDADTHHSIYSGAAIHPLSDTELATKSGKVTDWTLNGFSGPGTTANTSPELLP